MFSCAGCLLLHGLNSHCGEAGRGALFSSCGVQASRCPGFFCHGAWALGRVDFSSFGSWALEHRLSSWGTQA